MAERLIRVGNVSSVDYATGMIEVTYPDLDDSVTGKFPVFSFTDEYKMPKIGQEILVLHLSNGQSAGIVLGKYWNEGNKPAVSGVNVFRKELGASSGESYIQYSGGDMTLKDQAATLTLGYISRTLANHEQRISALEARI